MFLRLDILAFYTYHQGALKQGNAMRKSILNPLLFPLFLTITYGGYILLRVRHIMKIREPRQFYDTVEFMEIASRPVTSPTFWAGIKPPVTALLFKLCDSDPVRIMFAQAWISIIAWGVLALVLALIVRNFWLKPVVFVTVLSFSLVQNVILWDSLVISESISISLMAIFLAAAFWLLEKWEWYRFALLAVSAFLLANTRDTYAYFLLMAGVLVLILLFFSTQRIRILLVSGLFFALFLMVSVLSAVGMRYVVPFLMTTGMRILPNEEYVAYFEKRGMPITPALMERSGKPIQADENMLFDPDLEDYRQWVVDNGRSEYLRFLWFFKADTLQNPIRDAEWVLNPDLYYYAATGYRPIISSMRLNELLYSFRFGLAMSLFANLLAAALVIPAIQQRNPLWMIPIGLILLSYPQAVLVWNADAKEIARHSVSHVLMLRLGFTKRSSESR